MSRKHYNLTLQGQMKYAQVMLENIREEDLDQERDGVSYEIAKPTMPNKCPKCGYESYCDCVWIRSTDPDMPPTILRACPQCGKSVIEARPKNEPAYIVLDLSDDVTDFRGK